MATHQQTLTTRSSQSHCHDWQVYQCLHGTAASHLWDWELMTPYQHVCSSRSQSPGQSRLHFQFWLQKKKGEKKVSSKFLQKCRPKPWNNLQESRHTVESTEGFRHQLKRHLFSESGPFFPLLFSLHCSIFAKHHKHFFVLKECMYVCDAITSGHWHI